MTSRKKNTVPPKNNNGLITSFVTKVTRPKNIVKRAPPHPVPSIPIQYAPDVHLQPYIDMAMARPTFSGDRKQVYSLSNNTVQPNKKIKQDSKPARYGSKYGLRGPLASLDTPIVRNAPRGVTDVRQLQYNGRNNEIPDEWGITNKHNMPMQTITPTLGGKHSGRTGPLQ